MRILLINQYAGAPRLGMEYRPHWMAQEWQRLGHEVLIVAGDHSHLRRSQPPVGRSMVEGIEFLTLRTLPYSENGPRRFGNILSFRAQLRRRARALSSWHPDVVIASSTHPMDVRPALRLARKSGALFVHEVHDLWPLTPKLLGGLSERHPMIVWMQREEDLACRDADLVVSMLPATLPYLTSRGLDPSRWVHVSNGVPDAYLPKAGAQFVMEHGPFRVGYFGGHGHSNDLGTFIEAARLLQDQAIEFHLTGSGPLKAELQRQANDLERVRFHDQVPPDEARRRMLSMDALFMGVKQSPLYEHGIGLNKMFDYMAAGKPIIQAIKTRSSPTELAGCAVLGQPGDPVDVARAILRVRDLDPQQRAAMGSAGLDFVRARATHARLAEAFLAAVEERRAGPVTSAQGGQSDPLALTDGELAP